MQENYKISIFQGQEIRKILHNNEWWFSVVDAVQALTDSINARDYWYKMKIRVSEEEQLQLSTICRQLKLLAHDGKIRETDCANTEGIFRIIQSIPSPKAEPFKRWLAKVGYERVQEIENPELAQQRMRELYQAKGYSDSWIAKRIRGIEIRDELTSEWEQRGVKEQKDYAILTSEISKATFGMTPNEYRKFKSLKKENLRDHMNDLELIFTMLGEASTSEITKTQNSKGMPKLKQDSRVGGEIAGRAKKDLERKTKKSISTKDNYLEIPEKIKGINNDT